MKCVPCFSNVNYFHLLKDTSFTPCDGLKVKGIPRSGFEGILTKIKIRYRKPEEYQTRIDKMSSLSWINQKIQLQVNVKREGPNPSQY